MYGSYASINAVDIRDETVQSAIYLLYCWWTPTTVAALGLTYLGVVPSLWRAFGDVRRNYVHLVRSHGRVLPGMIFFTLFLFINADTWQASQYLTVWRVLVVLALFGAVSLLATGVQFREEIRHLRQPTQALVVEPGHTAVGRPDPYAALTRIQRLNIGATLGIRHLARAGWAGLAVFLFLTVLGTALATTELSRRWLGDGFATVTPLHLPAAMLLAATLVAAFAASYVAVTSMNDADSRAALFEPTVRTLRDLLDRHSRYAAAYTYRSDRIDSFTTELRRYGSDTVMRPLRAARRYLRANTGRR